MYYGDSMKNKLIEDINNYISHLNSAGLYVSVHGKTTGGLLEHNIHENPFCSFVKTNDEVWGKCVKCQQKVFCESNKDYFFGMCHAGVEEYVFFVDEFPLTTSGKIQKYKFGEIGLKLLDERRERGEL